MKKIKESAKEILNELKTEIEILNNQIKKQTNEDLENKVEKLKEKITIEQNNKLINKLILSISPFLMILGGVFFSGLFYTGINVFSVLLACCGATAFLGGGALVIATIKGEKKSKNEIQNLEKELEEFNKNPKLEKSEKSEKLLELESRKEELQAKYEKLSKEYENLVKFMDKEKVTKKAKANETKNTETKKQTKKEEIEEKTF